MRQEHLEVNLNFDRKDLKAFNKLLSKLTDDDDPGQNVAKHAYLISLALKPMAALAVEDPECSGIARHMIRNILANAVSHTIEDLGAINDDRFIETLRSSIDECILGIRNVKNKQ